MTVLLAEQDPLVSHTLQSMLCRAGFEVVAAASPEGLSLRDADDGPAVLVASTRHGRGATLPDLVLGAKRRWPQLRVVLVSGGGATPEEMALADRFLPKPFSGKALIQAVREVEESGRPPARAPRPRQAQGRAA